MSKSKESDTADHISRLGSVTPTRSSLSQVGESLSRTDGNHIREGLGSLNRWSQSTASSRSSTDYYRRLNVSQASRSPSPPAGHGVHSNDNEGLNSNSRMTPETRFDTHDNPRVLSTSNNDDQLRGHNPFQPSITSSHDHSSPFSTDVIAAATAPRTHSVSSGVGRIPHNFFNNPWMIEHDSRTDAARETAGGIHTRPILEAHSPRAQGPEVSLEESPQLFSGQDTGQEKRKRGQSQKAMLSKALQKANTAVLLDNAANFEGAMEAYNDACQLLHLVMLRSDGGEDEKLKLQEIVSLLTDTSLLGFLKTQCFFF